MFHILFSLTVYSIVFLLLALICKVYIDVKKSSIISNERFNDLNKLIKAEDEKNQQIYQKLVLVNNLHESLFNRLFKITNDILLFQNLIFDNRS